jgi:hypothetical protein
METFFHQLELNYKPEKISQIQSHTTWKVTFITVGLTSSGRNMVVSKIPREITVLVG